MSYILGLDVGIGSIGWSVIAIEDMKPTGLLDLGVRTFKVAENPKNGNSLNLERRNCRGRRKLLKRKHSRLKTARQLLLKYGVNIGEMQLPTEVWELRVKGLDEKLTPIEWSAVLLHLVKHRGYLSQRSDTKTTDKELGAVLSNISRNTELLKETGSRTPAELALNHFSPSGSIRNRSGDYSHSFNRLDLLEELKLLFKQQRAFGSDFASENFEEEIIAIFLHQNPPLSGDAILSMLGKCTFEPDEYKLAKNSYSAERFIWLSKLANLKIVEDGVRDLTESERALLIEQPYLKTKLTFAQVRKLLNLSEKATFNLCNYNQENAENATLIELKGYHTIRKLVSEIDNDYWETLKNDFQLMDDIANAFSLYKTDTDLESVLKEKVPEKVLTHLITNLNFDKFINLSAKALSKLLPLMETMSYVDACMAVYGTTGKTKTTEKQFLLPPVNKEDIKNPVVLRAISQTRKVINAIIRKYGTPTAIHIESGRELGKSFEDRRKIKKQQDKNQAEREVVVKKFKAVFGFEPKPKDILKWRLYEQQNGLCLYSGKRLEIAKLLTKEYEVDHALPFSRTFDDSFNNKVLVLTSENQNKKNKTPFEYLSGDKWEDYVKRVESCHFSHYKKQRLCLKKLDEKQFLERNLNDTRYIATFLKEYIKDNLIVEKVFSPNGQMTAFLRKCWGLTKNRELNCRHHALDAVVIACATVSMQQKITQFVKHKETRTEYVDHETGEIIQRFPEPWNGFSEEIKIRVFSDNPLEELKAMGIEVDFETVRPLFVSQAPNRKMTGRAHAETIRSAKYLDQKISTSRVSIETLSLKKLETLHNKESSSIYPILKERLEQFNDDPVKAFAEPVFDKNGSRIKKVKLQTTQNSGILINGGIADNDSLVQVNIYQNSKGQFLTTPIYAYQIAKKIKPTKWVSAKNEEDWQELTEEDKFLFDLKTGDLVRVETKKEVFVGYFRKYNRSGASINLVTHDESVEVKNFDSTIRNLVSFKKLEVDVLGYLA